MPCRLGRCFSVTESRSDMDSGNPNVALYTRIAFEPLTLAALGDGIALDTGVPKCGADVKPACMVFAFKTPTTQLFVNLGFCALGCVGKPRLAFVCEACKCVPPFVLQ